MKNYNLKYKFNDQLREVCERPSDVRSYIKEEISKLESETELVKIVESLGKLGNYSRILGDLELAEDALSEAMDLIVDNGLEHRLWVIYGAQLCHVYQYLDEYDVAQDMLFSLLEACENDESLSDMLALIHQHLGILYFNLNQFKESLREFEKSKEIESRAKGTKIEGLTEKAILLLQDLARETNVIPFPPRQPKGNFFEQYSEPNGSVGFLLNQISENEGLTIEELEKQLAVAAENHNNTPNEELFGLSPIQLREAINRPYESENILFNIDFGKSSFSEVPIVKQAKFLLSNLESVKEMKATQKGNLPRKFVLEIYNEYFKDDPYAFKPNKEEDLSELVRLKQLLLMSGLIKKRNNKFSLTQKGLNVAYPNNESRLFKILLETMFTKWNWAYDDLYSDLPFIQDSVIFNLYLIHKVASDWVAEDAIASLYLKVFPDLVDDVVASFLGPEAEVVNCFKVRFLERICLPLGILESGDERAGVDRLTYYKTTKLFNDCWDFLV